MSEPLIKIVRSKSDLNDAQNVRSGVFTVEQGIDRSIEQDGFDDCCDHIVAYLEGEAVGTVRIHYISDQQAKIERLAVKAETRGQKIGYKIMEKALNFLAEKNIKEIFLDSQYHAKSFYEKFGFKQIGDVFDEVGIVHVKMKKTL